MAKFVFLDFFFGIRYKKFQLMKDDSMHVYQLMLQAFLGINSLAKRVFISLFLVQTECVRCPWALQREHYDHY
jgi:hypothetical protein